MRKQKTNNINLSIHSDKLITILFIIGILIAVYVSYSKGFTNGLIEEKYISLSQSVNNYYNVSYGASKGVGARFEILNLNNSCIVIGNGTGISMKPFFSNLDIMIIDKCYPKNKLQVGDIIVYVNEEEGYISHRIVWISFKKKLVKTKGDWAIYQDEGYTAFNDIYGRVLGFINY